MRYRLRYRFLSILKDYFQISKNIWFNVVYTKKY